MPALYSHTTRAIGTTLTASIYNADHQNHITNGIPSQLDDYSTSVAEMQTNTDPGELGSESQAGSLAGELERLRFAIKEIKQVLDSNITMWYETPEPLTTLPRLPTWYIDGLEMSCRSASQTVIEVATGICRDAADTINMRVSTPLSRTVSAQWVTAASGGGNAGVTWAKFITKYVFVVKTAASTFDIGFDDVLTASNLLARASGTKYRRIGVARTATLAGAWQTFVQRKDEVNLSVVRSSSQVGAAPSGSNNNAKVVITNVPTGLILRLKLRAWVTGTGGFCFDNADTVGASGAPLMKLYGATAPIQEGHFWCNVSGELNYSASVLSSGARMMILGWKDERK